MRRKCRTRSKPNQSDDDLFAQRPERFQYRLQASRSLLIEHVSTLPPYGWDSVPRDHEHALCLMLLSTFDRNQPELKPRRDPTRQCSQPIRIDLKISPHFIVAPEVEVDLGLEGCRTSQSGRVKVE